MVDCYIALHKMRNAITAASNCCKQMDNHPKALTVSTQYFCISYQPTFFICIDLDSQVDVF